MGTRVLLEVLAGVLFLIGGVWYFRTSRALCERQRAQAQAFAARHPRWRWFFYPRWWYSTGQDIIAFRGSAIGMMIFGIIFLVIAVLTASHVHQ